MTKTRELQVHCKKCNHEWTIPLILPTDFYETIKQMKTAAEIGCPNCRANKSDILCGAKP